MIMIKLFLTFGVGMIINLTVFSQVIIPDKKEDTLYCFGSLKTKELIEDGICCSFYDSLYVNCYMEARFLERALWASDSLYSVLNRGFLLSEKENYECVRSL